MACTYKVQSRIDAMKNECDHLRMRLWGVNLAGYPQRRNKTRDHNHSAMQGEWGLLVYEINEV